MAHRVAAKTRTRLSTSCFTAYVQMRQALNQVTTLVLRISTRPTAARPSWPRGKASHPSLFNRVGELNRPLHRRLLSTCLATNEVDIFVPIWLPVLCVCPLLVRILRDRRVGLRTRGVNAIPFLSLSREQQSWPYFSLK